VILSPDVSRLMGLPYAVRRESVGGGDSLLHATDENGEPLKIMKRESPSADQYSPAAGGRTSRHQVRKSVGPGIARAWSAS